MMGGIARDFNNLLTAANPVPLEAFPVLLG
jgi:hypothetical protein